MLGEPVLRDPGARHRDRAAGRRSVAERLGIRHLHEQGRPGVAVSRTRPGPGPNAARAPATPARADRRAGGIGTEPLLAFDVPVTQRPFSLDVTIVPYSARAGRIASARIGASWVRAAPLVALRASAPYLHNGSVPRCARCSSPRRAARSASRSAPPASCSTTRVPGNGNQGHEFGAALSPAEKQDLIAFLETLSRLTRVSRRPSSTEISSSSTG